MYILLMFAKAIAAPDCSYVYNILESQIPSSQMLEILSTEPKESNVIECLLLKTKNTETSKLLAYKQNTIFILNPYTNKIEFELNLDFEIENIDWDNKDTILLWGNNGLHELNLKSMLLTKIIETPVSFINRSYDFISFISENNLYYYTNEKLQLITKIKEGETIESVSPLNPVFLISKNNEYFRILKPQGDEIFYQLEKSFEASVVELSPDGRETIIIQTERYFYNIPFDSAESSTGLTRLVVFDNEKKETKKIINLIQAMNKIQSHYPDGEPYTFDVKQVVIHSIEWFDESNLFITIDFNPCTECDGGELSIMKYSIESNMFIDMSQEEYAAITNRSSLVFPINTRELKVAGLSNNKLIINNNEVDFSQIINEKLQSESYANSGYLSESRLSIYYLPTNDHILVFGSPCQQNYPIDICNIYVVKSDGSYILIGDDWEFPMYFFMLNQWNTDLSVFIISSNKFLNLESMKIVETDVNIIGWIPRNIQLSMQTQ